MSRDYLKMDDLNAKETMEVIELSAKIKGELRAGKINKSLENKTLIMIFQKNSTRTRVSFEVGMTQLGGHALFMDATVSQISRGETMYDTGAVLGKMGDAIMARLYKHADMVDLAKGSPAPVISGLDDLEHPCQVLADILTVKEKGKLVKGNKFVYVGDCQNNMANSLVLGFAMMGLDVTLVGPKEYPALPEYLEKAKKYGTKIEFTSDIPSGLKNADIVYTDVWVSMGMEKENEARMKAFPPYQVTSKVMSYAKKDAVFMHCLPAHRGMEVSADVIDGPQSVVFDEAENRLHAQKGLLVYLLAGKK